MAAALAEDDEVILSLLEDGGSMYEHGRDLSAETHARVEHADEVARSLSDSSRICSHTVLLYIASVDFALGHTWSELVVKAFREYMIDEQYDTSRLWMYVVFLGVVVCLSLRRRLAPLDYSRADLRNASVGHAKVDRVLLGLIGLKKNIMHRVSEELTDVLSFIMIAALAGETVQYLGAVHGPIHPVALLALSLSFILAAVLVIVLLDALLEHHPGAGRTPGYAQGVLVLANNLALISALLLGRALFTALGRVVPEIVLREWMYFAAVSLAAVTFSTVLGKHIPSVSFSVSKRDYSALLAQGVSLSRSLDRCQQMFTMGLVVVTAMAFNSAVLLSVRTALGRGWDTDPDEFCAYTVVSTAVAFLLAVVADRVAPSAPVLCESSKVLIFSLGFVLGSAWIKALNRALGSEALDLRLSLAYALCVTVVALGSTLGFVQHYASKAQCLFDSVKDTMPN